jgi:hypothetical protein
MERVLDCELLWLQLRVIVKESVNISNHPIQNLLLLDMEPRTRDSMNIGAVAENFYEKKYFDPSLCKNNKQQATCNCTSFSYNWKLNKIIYIIIKEVLWCKMFTEVRPLYVGLDCVGSVAF